MRPGHGARRHVPGSRSKQDGTARPDRGRLHLSVCNPGVDVVLGILLYEQRLTRPTWHVFVAIAALLAALAGATIITLANRETPMPDEAVAGDRSTADPAPA